MTLSQIIKVLMNNVPAKEGRDEIIAKLRAAEELADEVGRVISIRAVEHDIYELLLKYWEAGNE